MSDIVQIWYAAAPGDVGEPINADTLSGLTDSEPRAARAAKQMALEIGGPARVVKIIELEVHRAKVEHTVERVGAVEVVPSRVCYDRPHGEYDPPCSICER